MATEHKLNFHVVSASLEGVVKVTRARWSEIVYRFPRTALKEAAAVEELQGSGIYFLMGEKEGRPSLYIGQAQNVYRRLTQHSVNDSKGFWAQTLVLTSTGDAVFNAAHLNYLENRFHELASDAARMDIENSMPPSVGCGITTIQQEMDECITHTGVVLNLMGYHFLEKQPECMEIKPQPEKKPALPVAAERMPEMPEPPQRLAGDLIEIPPAKPRTAKYNFYVMGLHDGDVLVYEDKDPAHRTEAVVCGPDKIQVNGEVMTPHALAKRIRQTNNVYAFAYLSYKGVKLCHLYNHVYKNIPLPKAPAEDDTKKLRYFTVAGADAVGRLTDDGGIIVLKGSRICVATQKSCPKSAAALRADMASETELKQDMTFTSLSAAAAFVGGCSLNGKLCWLETRKVPKRRKKS